MDTNRTKPYLGLLILVAIAACGRETEQAAPADNAASESPQAAEPAGMGGDIDPPALSRSPAPADARVFFIAPKNGDVVSNPVKVEFGIAGMDVLPAGQAAPASGHHHVLIDTGLPVLGLPIPADANHVHFGDGRSSTELTLEPGEHTLQLLFADHLHIPHEPPVYSDPITITVE